MEMVIVCMTIDLVDDEIHCLSWFCNAWLVAGGCWWWLVVERGGGMNNAEKCVVHFWCIIVVWIPLLRETTC